MADACPWSSFGFEPATISFCERRLCQLVVEPANTWSNIGYLIAGLVVIHLAKKHERSDLQPIGYIAVFLSFASSALHGTGTFWGEWVDHVAMNAFAGFALGFNLWRLKPMRPRMIYTVIIVAAAIPSLAMLLYKSSGILLFTAIIVITGILEIAAYRRRSAMENPSRRHLIYLCLWFLLAYGIWNLDYHHLVCNPDNHLLQGHSLWHLFNAMCFYHLFRYYCQYPKLGD